MKNKGLILACIVSLSFCKSLSALEAGSQMPLNDEMDQSYPEMSMDVSAYSGVQMGDSAYNGGMMYDQAFDDQAFGDMSEYPVDNNDFDYSFGDEQYGQDDQDGLYVDGDDQQVEDQDFNDGEQEVVYPDDMRDAMPEAVSSAALSNDMLLDDMADHGDAVANDDQVMHVDSQVNDSAQGEESMWERIKQSFKKSE